jgi:predicted MPP superfamily phosphohydrolase
LSKVFGCNVMSEHAPAGKISRRKFLKVAAVGSVMGGVVLAAARCGSQVTPQDLQVDEVEVPIARLPRRLDGLRIVQLSDLHLSAVVSLEHIQYAVSIAQSLAGELIVLTGDYVTRGADGVVTCAQALAGLRAPLGVYATLGNHDYWNGATHVADSLAAAGLTVLRNEGTPIARDGGDRADLWLAGLDDVWEEQEDLEAALDGAPEGTPTLLLVHEPDFADQYADRAADLGIILQLSGHSHGGQVRLPVIGAPVLPRLGQKYPMGLQKAGDTWVYTNRGVGLVMPAVRLNCPPEITALTLRGV